jgi:hypothetical protein
MIPVGTRIASRVRGGISSQPSTTVGSIRAERMLLLPWALMLINTWRGGDREGAYTEIVTDYTIDVTQSMII